MSTLITIIIAYYLLIIIIIIVVYELWSYGVIFIKFVDIDCFLCNSYPCVLFESLSHVINQESHVYSWNLGKIYLVRFLKFWISLVSLGRFQNFEKVNSVNVSQISLLNMWLLLQISDSTSNSNLRSNQ